MWRRVSEYVIIGVLIEYVNHPEMLCYFQEGGNLDYAPENLKLSKCSFIAV
jgi:hypothetical protein